MSIIIKGVDLPNSGQIELIIRPHGKVFSKTRGISAEAIQIPTPHGRLIDADKLKMECYHAMDELVESTTMNISAEALSLLCGFTMIGEAPTILEAET